MSTAAPLVRGDVVLVRFPFTDLSGHKLRPALVVGQPRGSDVILAFVTSRTASLDAQAEYYVDAAHPEFALTGLKTSSIIRLDKLATLHRSLVQRRLGYLGPQGERAVVRGLRYVFQI